MAPPPIPPTWLDQPMTGSQGPEAREPAMADDTPGTGSLGSLSPFPPGQPGPPDSQDTEPDDKKKPTRVDKRLSPEAMEKLHQEFEKLIESEMEKEAQEAKEPKEAKKAQGSDGNDADAAAGGKGADPVLEEVKKNGFVFGVRTTAGARFERHLQKLPKDQIKAYKKQSRADKEAFRMQWAQEEYEKYTKRRSFSDEYFEATANNGVYVNWETLVEKEGGFHSKAALQGAKTYVKNCIKRGGKWVQHNAMNGRTQFLHVQKSLSDGTKKNWGTHADESNHPDPKEASAAVEPTKRNAAAAAGEQVADEAAGLAKKNKKRKKHEQSQDSDVDPTSTSSTPKRKKRKTRKGQEKDDTDKKHGTNDNGEKKHDKNGSADDKKKGGTKGGTKDGRQRKKELTPEEQAAAQVAKDEAKKAKAALTAAQATASQHGTASSAAHTLLAVAETWEWAKPDCKILKALLEDVLSTASNDPFISSFLAWELKAVKQKFNSTEFERGLLRMSETLDPKVKALAEKSAEITRMHTARSAK